MENYFQIEFFRVVCDVILFLLENRSVQPHRAKKYFCSVETFTIAKIGFVMKKKTCGV